MKKHLGAFLIVLAFASNSLASVPDGFDLAAWNNWIAKVVATGVPTQTDHGVLITVTKLKPADTTHQHEAVFFSAVGAYDAHGVFVVDHIEDVSNKISINADGTRQTDEWHFAASPVGDLSQTRHHHLVQTADGAVTSDTEIDEVPELAMATWIGQLNLWYAVTTGPAGQFPVPAP